MKKIYAFASKPMKVFRIVTLAIICLAFILLMVFAFNVIALIVGILMLIIVALALLYLNRRKIIIDKDCLILAEIFTECINAKNIDSIECTYRGLIEIKTIDKIYHTGGFVLGKNSYNTEKNQRMVEELNKWLKRYKHN